jgi:hypothetical protein
MRKLSRTLSSAALAMAVGVCLPAVRGGAQEMQKAPAAVPAAPEKVEPEAVAALKRMSAYLSTLTAFEVQADTTRELVTANGQKLQVGGVTRYTVRRPNGFQIDVATDYKQRRFYYDGKQFTVYAPQLGYYATAPAPPTILQTLDEIEAKFGISVPLVDLFRWNDPASGPESDLRSGFLVGAATIDGAATDHYAFRENDRDWEIWIQQGAQPLPRKIAIVDLSDEARPTYVARLNWNVSPTIAADAFAFKPGPDAKAIKLAAMNQ